MMMLIVLLAATSVPAPSFVMTPVAGENFSAEVFEQTESVTSEALIDRLIREQGNGSPKEVSRRRVDPQAEVEFVALKGPDETVKALLLRNADPDAAEQRWVCRIGYRGNGSAGLERATRWCFSFVAGPRVAVPLPPISQATN